MEELDHTHAELLLATQMIGRLGCYADGKVYVIPITYVYENGCAYGHTNRGMKLEMLRKNPEVCLEVDEISGFDDWRSVVAWGRFEELTGPEAADAIGLLTTRLGDFLAEKENIPPEEVDIGDVEKAMRLAAKKGVIYRINIKEMTGRYSRHGKLA